MKVKIFNISWDTDEEETDLPSKIVFNFKDKHVFDDIDIDEFLSDILSDEYGFCVNGFQYEII